VIVKDSEIIICEACIGEYLINDVFENSVIVKDSEIIICEACIGEYLINDVFELVITE